MTTPTASGLYRITFSALCPACGALCAWHGTSATPAAPDCPCVPTEGARP